MADLDTAAKRFSGLTWSSGDIVLPIPDGADGAGDRLHLLDLYSGIAAGGGGGASDGVTGTAIPGSANQDSAYNRSAYVESAF